MKRLSLFIPLLLAVGCHKADNPDDAGDAKPLVEVSTSKLTFGSIAAGLTVTGTISPLPGQEAKVSPVAAGRLKTVNVKVGDEVRKGQVIATLDPTTTPGQVSQAKGAVETAKATLKQAKINLATQIRTQASTVDQAKLNLEAQQVALTKLRNGSRPQEIAQARAGVASAQASQVNARQALTRAQSLFRDGLIARKDLEAAQEQLQLANAALATAQQSLSLAQQGNRREDIRAAEVAVSLAEQQLKTAESQDIVIAARRQDVHIAEGQLMSAMGASQSAVAQSNTLTIVAPVSGVVVGRTLNPGEAVDVTSVVASIINLQHARLILNVPVGSAGEVRVGQAVSFTTDQDLTLRHSATVTVVNRAVDAATNTVQVEATILGSPSGLRDDGLVKATILTKVDPHALLAPLSALVQKDGKSVVYTIADETAKAHEVTIVTQNNESAEIKGDLKAGDEVVTKGAYELDDGSKTKEAK